MQIGRGYGDFDEYSLSAIEASPLGKKLGKRERRNCFVHQVHAPSEHTLRKASWALEVQLWHAGVSPRNDLTEVSP